MKLKEAAKKVEDGIEETLTYCDFPSEHWTRIRTNNVIERLNREIRRRTRVVGTFPDGNSALMLVCARLRHVAGTQWGSKKYMNMKHLEAAHGRRLYCRLTSFSRSLQINLRINLDGTNSTRDCSQMFFSCFMYCVSFRRTQKRRALLRQCLHIDTKVSPFQSAAEPNDPY